MNPAWQQRKLLEFCKAKGVVITAYSPLGAVNTIWGTNRVMENGLLNQIAEAHGKTVAQVSIHYLIFPSRLCYYDHCHLFLCFEEKPKTDVDAVLPCAVG